MTPSVGGDAAAAQLRLINVGPSADGRHVHLHSIAHDSRVTTIQLETTVATAFHSPLGEILLSLSSSPVAIGTGRMN